MVLVYLKILNMCLKESIQRRNTPQGGLIRMPKIMTSSQALTMAIVFSTRSLDVRLRETLDKTRAKKSMTALARLLFLNLMRRTWFTDALMHKQPTTIQMRLMTTALVRSRLNRVLLNPI